MKKNTNTSSGIRFTGLLTILFIALKLLIILISWLWVLSPVWIPIVLFFLGFVLFIIFKSNGR